jgi:hypothetical protein
MGERTDIKTLREKLAAMREKLNGKGKRAAWITTIATILGVAGYALEKGWIAPGFVTTAYADSTYETKERAEETFQTKEDARELLRASDIAHIRMQGAIDAIEKGHDEHERKIDRVQRSIELLLWDRKIQPPPEEP